MSGGDETSTPELVVRTDGAATDEEVAAILAAYEALWPRPVASGVEPSGAPQRWRFSGRWWSKPVPTRRDRPWPTR